MANTIGTAYIQIEPTAKGISGKISSELGGEMGDAGEKSGHSFSQGFGSVIGGVGKLAAGAVAAAGTAIAGVVKGATSAYSEFEQLEGGAKLLFGEAFDTVSANASTAFSRVQMSANDYLSQVNSYATGLKESLGGDSDAAADLADKIIVAQADIVAATGASQESIANAFNGIMKNNFSMLDNLQLGIKPTKEGMQEVIDKMNEWNATQGKTTNYQMDNLADMQSAIVDYVSYVGMADYAQNEASSTIQGSLATMGAAWSNLLTGMATEGADMDSLIDNLVTSIDSFADNIIPVVERALSGVSQLISKLAPVIATELPKIITENLPVLLDAVINTAQALLDGLLAVLPSILDTLISALPDVINALIQLTMGIVQALPQILNALLVALPTLIPMVVESLTTALPTLIQGLITLVMGIVQALPEIINALILELPNIIGMIVDSLLISLPLLIDGTTQLIIALATHLPEICMALIEAIPLIIQRIGESIVTYGPTLLTSLQTLGQTLLGYITQFGTTIHTNASTFFTNFINNFKSWLSQLPQQMSYWLGMMVGKFATFMFQLPAKAIVAFSNLITKVKDFGSKMVEEGKRMAKEFAEKLITKFKELPDKIKEIGKNIIDGLKKGVEEAWDSFTSWFKDLFDNFIKGVQEHLEIRSPSKVFRDEIGQWIPAGIAEGIEDGIGTINSAMADMTMAVSPSVMGDVKAYAPSATAEPASNTSLYDLLARYLPIIASGDNVNVTLDVTADRLFRIVQAEQRRNTQLVGVGNA